ncbi:MAG TPA: GntG family PLP-dependent aldolase [Candidatus Micrarchaeia archaeon]|nr:GntG family PLP-dependent aldolase [Candidatus Micrarchaeia archaeon]
MTPIDLRSDTVTQPTGAMRDAMRDAALGDDVYGEDPTVNELEQAAAARLGKAAAVLVPTGTMANLLALLVHAGPRQEVIVEADSHIFVNEAAGAAVVGGIQLRPLATARGVMDPEQVAGAIRPGGDSHQPTTAAVAVENTHNRKGGVVWTGAELGELAQLARARHIAVHMDGARVFNAAVALGADPRTIAAHADTVSFCLSKGLGCPVGSLLVGPPALIARAREWRKMLGGGMRQAGIIAACGLIGLATMVERLAEDHDNARTLALGLAELPGTVLDPDAVATNIVCLRLTRLTAPAFVAAARERGLLCLDEGAGTVRLVTHLGIGPADISRGLAIAEAVLSA